MDLKRDMNNIEKPKIHKQSEVQYPSVILLKSDPSYSSKATKNAVNDEINGLLRHISFAYYTSN